MDETDLILAKEIFFNSGCSHFFMSRGNQGEFDYYNSLKISKDQELEWVREYEIDELNKLMGNAKSDKIHLYYRSLSEVIKNYKNFEVLAKLIEIAEHKVYEYDSFTRLLIAESILRVVDYFEKKDIKNGELDNAKRLGVNILWDIVQKPIIASDYFLKKHPKETKEENIKNRVQKNLLKYD